jgi:hypothetical protein
MSSESHNVEQRKNQKGGSRHLSATVDSLYITWKLDPSASEFNLILLIFRPTETFECWQFPHNMYKV